MQLTAPGTETKTTSFLRLAFVSCGTRSKPLNMRFRRLIALVLTLVVVLSILEVPNHAQEDLLIARSRALVLTANPLYVVAPPPQDRIPAKPPNLTSWLPPPVSTM